MKTLYFHGLPGSGAELGLARDKVDWAVFDRNASSFAQLAIALPPGPLHLVGFSLGAACALRLAALAPEKIARLTLVSAAAPLELGDFLPHMAGAPVFRAARSYAQLSVLTNVQATLSRLSPSLMARLLAKGTAKREARLITSAPVTQALRAGLTQQKAVYLREISAYVMPWAKFLPLTRCPVTLVHGEADLWAPIGMAEALTSALPHAELIRVPEAGHYMTLKHVLDSVTGQPGNTEWDFGHRIPAT